ncbi:MAG: heme ABC transporter ATP-binding protein [Parcubacteria group bacterium Greene0714_36]|nr:MAG: heme ABC transporter ATP-binding protein [Parcubacteria group bacterium Greene0714_36]
MSFNVRAGEIVGLLGPNGAGKTTTIDMILGIVEPSDGSIRVFGKEFAPHRSEILARTNFSAVYAHLPGNTTVRQNLFIFALLYGVMDAKRRIADLLKEFDLERFARVRTGFLSSGEQSRAHLAKAMLNSPRLLLMDEPTASIDPSDSQIIREKIKSYVSATGAAVLWTSHDMYEIEAVCDRVLFISHGKILLEGNPKELPVAYGKRNLEELFIAVAREPLSLQAHL